MESAEKIKDTILENFTFFKEKNVAVGAVDPSRFDGSENYCVIIPETREIISNEIGGGYTAQTRFTISMMFRGSSYQTLVSRMEKTAVEIENVFFGGIELTDNATEIEMGETKYFYNCGTLERQATGLDISLTIKENVDL